MWQNHLNYPGSSAQAITIKATSASNALQTEQFLVCRVTSRYNHWFSDRTSIPCMKARPEILQPYIFYNTSIVFITTSFKVLITDTNLVKHYTRHKFHVQSLSSGKKTRRLQHVAKVYQASPSKVSLIGVVARRRRIPLYRPGKG